MNGCHVSPTVLPAKWPARVKNMVGGGGRFGRLLLNYKAVQGGKFMGGFHGGQQQRQGEAEDKHF